MGKGSHRRPALVGSTAKNWKKVFGERKVSPGKTSYVWCVECKAFNDVVSWCGHSSKKETKKATYGFALMPGVPSDTARLLQHDQMDFQSNTYENVINKINRRQEEKRWAEYNG